MTRPAYPIELAEGPHSRACQIYEHPHGGRCAVCCPTCNTYRHSDDGPDLVAPERFRREHEISAPLLAICDVLVVRALEAVGKRLVRVERSRFKALGTAPWHEAHTIWQPSEETLAKTLDCAWDIVPELVGRHAPGTTAWALKLVLDGYVRDLVITGTAHTLDELRYRLANNLPPSDRG